MSVVCFLCSLGHPDDARAALWTVECQESEIKQSVFTCNEHYGAIVMAAGPRARVWHGVKASA